MNKFFISFVLLSIFTASCSGPAPTEISLPVQVVTLPPTQTMTAVPTFTNTPEQPTQTPDVIAAMLPSGAPDSEWNGIPIMPGAINGEGDAQGYTFTIQSDAGSIQQFYQAQLANLGYDLFATGQSDENKPVMLMFMKDASIVSVSIFTHEDLMVVLIVK
jgi:hypothetical protein